MIDFSSLGLPINLAIFAAAAVVVWFAGVRITHYAEAIAGRTGIGQAVIGMILLAGVTSLPEIGVTLTASVSGNAPLAINNLFGSIALQAALLAVVDFAIGRRALTSVVPQPQVMLQGTLNVILLALVTAGMVVGDVAFLGVGAWAWGCLLAYVAAIWVLSREEGRRPWLAARDGKIDQNLVTDRNKARERQEPRSGDGLTALGLKVAGVAAAILVAGYLLSRTGQALATQTGLGASFVGFVLIAFSTSLPELSTALAAARQGLFTMAISDILGTNLINIGLVFVVDLASPGAPVLNATDSFAAFGALLGIAITGAFVAGLAERRDTTVWRMGLDSIAVAILYLGGLVLLYGLR